MKLKNLKKRRQIKQGKKEGSSKSTTDTSSESTPVGSPKRRSNTKETNQMSKQENPDDIFTESSNDCSSGSRRKGQTKKNDVVTHLQRKSEGKKGNKRKPQENKIAKTEKPATRRKSSVSTSPGDKHKKKTSALNAEASAEVIGAKEVIENLDLRSGGCKENKETNKSGKRIKKNTDDCGSEISLKDLNVIEFSKLTAEVKAAKEKIGKKVNRKLKGKKEKSENSDEWQNIQSNTILRLRHSTREKTELVKRLKKKFQNSKRILEMKETKKSQSGNRRSLRLKTLQGSDDRMEILNEQSAFSGEKGEEKNLCQKTIKMTRPVENIENCLIVKQKKAYAAKSLKTTHEKKTVKEIKETSSADPIRRSSRSLLVRKSFNSESPLLEKKIEVNFIDTCQSFADYSKNISLLGKDTKNIYDGMETTTPFVAEDSSNKKSPQIQTEKNAKPIEENLNSLFIQGQVSVLNKNRLHSPRFSRENEKLETTDLGTLDTTRNRDLEEMPILAKVEPILGKFYRKNEQDIPILMPVVEESRDHQSSQAEETCKSISFQIIKKRKKASKEVAPLKIVKKVDNTVQKKESGVTFRLEGSNRSRSSRRVLSETKKVKKKISVAFEKEAASSVAKCSKNPSVSKYFLGICPCEIDKGREETNEESGSDSEPLITLINQSQKAKSINSSATKSNENEKEIENTNEKKDEIKNRSSDEAQMAKSDDYKVEKVTEPVSELPSEFLPTTKVHEREDKLLVLSESEQNNKIKFKSDIKVDTNLKAKIRKSKKSTKTNNEVNVTINEPSELKLEILSLPLKYNDKIPKEPSPPLLFHSPLQSEVKEGFQTETNKETILPERRSRRISKETKSTGEFIIDDPLILVDELWSELDSDSDSSKKKSRKTKKKTIKKKCLDEKKTCDVNLEELLRNFGEKKDCLNSDKNKSSVTALPLKITKFHGTTFQSVNVRKILENRVVQKSYKRLSLKLFRFNKAIKNFGRKGERLSDVKKALQGKQDLIESKKNNLPDLPFLAAEIKQNPVQVIKCHSQKPKSAKKGLKTSESKSGNANAIRLKISLPLESINNMAVFNNNHLTELEVEKKTIQIAEEQETPKNNEEKELYSLLSERDCSIPQEDQVENGDLKNKMKRYEVIDKIFYCEICKTYYYSSSQLKIHKLSNRHKLKETEFLSNQRKLDASETADEETNAESAQIECKDPNLPSASESVGEAKSIEPEKLNDDTLEMPILEGPFIENPLTRLGIDTVEPQSPSPNSFGFSQDSLKDIQRAIGCTDEEMLILTLLGENTIEIENDILDLNSCRPVQGKSATISSEKGEGNIEKANGILKVDLKQRMTSALACLVNKAVFNLLQKYESVAKSSVNPEAVSLLGKLSNLSRRKNILQLNELLKKQKEGEPPVGNLYKDVDKKEPSISYKYQCTICGSRFEKASTRECHISRSHKGKAKKFSDEIQVLQTTAEEEWNDFWSYDASEIPMGNTSQFWCSGKCSNFTLFFFQFFFKIFF